MSESVGVPFITVGNRRALTMMAVMDCEYVAAFVRRFADCFECDPSQDLIFLIEEGAERSWPKPRFSRGEE